MCESRRSRAEALVFEFKAACLIFTLLTLAGCGTASLDLSGYPDKAHDRLYADGRLGGDKGLASFDVRKAWRAVSEPLD